MKCLFDDNPCDKANTFADCSGCTVHGLETFPNPHDHKAYTEYLAKKYGGQRKIRREKYNSMIKNRLNNVVDYLMRMPVISTTR